MPSMTSSKSKKRDTSPYNVLSRPKRTIHLANKAEPTTSNPNLCTSSSDSEDADFECSSSESEMNESGVEHSNGSVSGDSETGPESGEEDPIKLEKPVKAKKTPKSEKRGRPESGPESGEESKLSKENPVKLEKSDKANKTPKSEKRGRPPKKENGELKVPIATKRKYKKKKRDQVYGNPMEDEETQKFISKFKNSNIKIKKSKTVHKPRKSKLDNDNDSFSTQQTTSTGPFVKSQIHTTDSTSFPIYTIHQSYTNDTNDATVHKKRVLPRDNKIPPIVDLKTPATCVFCQNESRFMPSIGLLFGPYRIGTEANNAVDEEDMTIEWKSGKILDGSEVDFKEVWFHEGCAVWTPNIFFVCNRIKGISGALDAAADLKCSSCKKSGSSLVCHKNGCKKIYHYPCALKEESCFNKDFTIYCKQHSEAQID